MAALVLFGSPLGSAFAAPPTQGLGGAGPNPGAGGAGPAPLPKAAVPSVLGGELVLFEAASLKDVFARLIPRFEKEHAGARIVTNAAGSQELRTQIEHGAAVDVFASADRKHMDALVGQGLALAPVIFACNEPVVVVRTALAASIKTFADLPRAERIVLGAPEVPVGAYAQQILEKAVAKWGAEFSKGVEARVVSRELNVRQVLAKVVLGEADAGIVYRSDALVARGKVDVVAIPPELNVTAEYPIAVLKAAPHPALAREWVTLLRSPAGVEALREAGFVRCPSR
jgi:molybdate transport system substrate-binding protein